MARFDPLQVFLQEAEDLLVEVEECALGLAAGDTSPENINRLFRAFHTLKGSGGMCGLDKISSFTHHIEEYLDKARNGVIPISGDLTGLLLKARDHLRFMLVAEQGGEPVSTACTESLLAELAATESTLPPRGREWTIRFHPHPALFHCGGDPVLALRELTKMGSCKVTAQAQEIPALDEMDPETCYLRWTIHLTTQADAVAIQDVFAFVEDGAELEISPAGDVLPPQRSNPTTGDVPARAPARESTVRVPSQRLDRLVNLVGELVMNQSRLSQAAARSGSVELANPIQELERLVAELRDDVLEIRMLPIGSIFGRFRRLVHDLSLELGKEVDLVTEGAETELDKSILDQLGEPLVHLLRNSIDHGIEPVSARLSAGKPKRGTVALRASHIGSAVVISISDDGRGLNRAAIRAKAVERRLIAADAQLNDKELLHLILAPGFSTASAVTNVSGRGVGMDVVKKQIDALSGSLSIASVEGQGSTISLTLPLTLAIIEGLLVGVGPDQFIVPMTVITETMELPHADRMKNNGRNLIEVRGELIPYVGLRETFGVEGECAPVEKVVIVRHEDQRVGLVVDRVLGTHQTVIQSLGRFYRAIDIVSGATILGDGQVALVLDSSAVVRSAERMETATPLEYQVEETV